MQTIFKAYDIRGRYPEELDEDCAYLIGCAYASFLVPKTVIVGRDIRLSSHTLFSALCKGLADCGVDVYDIGVCGTEQVYFAVCHLQAEGGIMVTASHNPRDYNGMKFVRERSIPISGDSGLSEIRDAAINKAFTLSAKKGSIKRVNINDDYAKCLLSFVDIEEIKPFKITVNAGNGGAGLIIDLLEPHLNLEFVRLNHNPDGAFPNGVPNPLLPENRDVTAQVVISTHSDLGIAWDGDFDRCFFFDEKGRFVEGYYMVGLLAEEALQRYPGAKIIIDPRLRWNSLEIISSYGGTAVISKAGHTFIKERMAREDAVYGGEMSAHHYFREFSYCDSGMIPWLRLLGILSRRGVKLSGLIDNRAAMFPISGEINRSVLSPQEVIEKVKSRYEDRCLSIDYIDGLSMEFEDWRFNLRSSNTEPLLRLNVESKGDPTLMRNKTNELLAIIEHQE